MIKQKFRNKFLPPLMIKLIASLLLVIFTTQVTAQSAAELDPFWDDREEDSNMLVDHSAWQSFLTKYVDDQHPSGINRVDYSGVSRSDYRAIESYLEYLQSLDPRQLNSLEQKAYWINLYNASTVFLILQEDDDLRSIRQIRSGFLTPGPWERKIFSITLQSLSLDDIEHRILRPIWQDSRIHYAVNCASMSCPNLPKTAFTAANVEAMLDSAAREYINHPRAVSRINGTLTLSKIYQWYADDFGESIEDLYNHLRKYASPETQLLLEPFSRPEFEYDWALNRP